MRYKAEELPGVTTDRKGGKGYPLPINSIILDGNVTFWTVTWQRWLVGSPRKPQSTWNMHATAASVQPRVSSIATSSYGIYQRKPTHGEARRKYKKLKLTCHVHADIYSDLTVEQTEDGRAGLLCQYHSLHFDHHQRLLYCKWKLTMSA